MSKLFKRMAAAVMMGASLCGSSLIFAAGKESASFLDIPLGAGPAALGGAYTALATDLYAPVWNPAGLGFLDSVQVGGQHLAYLESIHYEHVGFVTPLGRAPSSDSRDASRPSALGALGFSAQYLGSGDIPGADNSGAGLPSFSSHFGAYSVAYGRAWGETLAVGLTGKMIEAKISDVSAQAYAADLGALYKVADHTTVAATITNLGGKLRFLNDDSSLPVAVHLGTAYAGSHWLASLEGLFPKSGTAGAHMGVQWSPVDVLAIRAGYKTENTKELGAMAGLTVGAGISLWNQELAYAWLPYGDLGDTQYISLILRFGEPAKGKENIARIPDDPSQRDRLP